MPKIAVLGAGINGISSALAIQKRIQKAEVTVIADKFSPNVTSDVAAGFIEPYLCGDDVERIMKWTKSTISRIQDYMAAGNVGAEEMSGYWLQSVKEVPKWLEIMKNVKVYDEKDMEAIRKRPEHKFGVFYTTWYVEPTPYLQWSTQQFLKNGGKFKKQFIEDISEVSAQYDIIVNCTGLGSRKLFNDHNIYPVRGQIMRVSCPSVKHFLIDDDYYALLNGSCIILGGTKDQNNWDTSIDPLTASRIFEGNCRNIPSLRNAKIISHHCDLRPVRDTVRLEIEKRSDGVVIVHNYGHGGSGITLHWGCAMESAELVEKVLEKKGGKAKL